MRVLALAKQLDIETKQLIDICKELGFDIKSHLQSITPEQAEAVAARLKQGPKASAHAPAAPITPVVPQPMTTKVQTLPTRKTAAPPAPSPPAAAATPAVAAPPPPVAAPAVPTPAPAAPTAAPRPATPAAPHTAPAQPPSVTAQRGTMPPRQPSTLPPRPSTMPPRPTPPSPGAGGRPDSKAPTSRRPLIRRPSGQGSFIAKPPTTSLRAGGSAPASPKAPAPTQKKLADIPQHLIEQGRNITAEQVIRHQQQQQNPTDVNYVPPAAGDMEEDDARGDKKKPGAVGGRDVRRAARNVRARARTDGPAKVQLEGGRVTLVEEDRPTRLRDRLKHRAKTRQPGTAPRKGKVQVTLPITVRVLSEAVGLTFAKLVPKLVELGLPFNSFNINSVLDPEVAELVAQSVDCELDIRKPQDAEDTLLARHEEPDDPAKLLPRPPVVTIMGHVDHGKTSLLDRVRKSNVVDTEAGGITQVIRAWQVEHDGKPITFLDTPGHQAFTKMRARGAQVTDIAVIVVAADDGVMPQTEEAINHAKAAGVKIVVAINKIDLPNANLAKTRQQLYSLNLLPDDMGGDVPFVETSAAKGVGIDKLLEAIQLVSELQLDLQANPDKPGRGTCLEAHLSGDEGVFATLLVQEGTLRKGDIVLCGPAYGRVRAMYNDVGAATSEAGPSVPVRITGLDEVPNADDAFAVVADIATAREIAEKRRSKQQQADLVRFEPMTLEKLGAVKIAELKVILKADFRGSVEAIRKELEKLQHEEVRVRVLHSGIGGITASDVQLAMTSPTDTLVVGFNAVPDDEAMDLAEQLGVQIREYSIIYNLTDDIKSALEGKLKPRQEVIHLGRALVREVFKISKVGAVAGCHVTQGTIERSAKVRIIRDGVVIYPPAERTVGLESLKHHKDDVKEIKQGYDCGLKISGYDDVKVGDVIEAYRVEEIKRTL